MATDQAPVDPLEERLLAHLRASREGAIVITTSRKLGAEPRAVEGLLRALRGRGLAVCAQEGTPPVTTWRAAPTPMCPRCGAPSRTLAEIVDQVVQLSGRAASGRDALANMRMVVPSVVPATLVRLELDLLRVAGAIRCHAGTCGTPEATR